MKTCYVDVKSRSIADLVDRFGQGMLITRINVPHLARGKGHARALLKQILDDADREKVTLFLEIFPSGGLNFEELEAWYRRHGFHQYMGHYRRVPQVRLVGEKR